MYAIGFGFGVVRVLLVAPHIGATAAVAIEVPAMLVLAWLVCRRIIATLHVPHRYLPRLAMSGIAFAVVMGCEIAIGIYGFGRSLAAAMPDIQSLAGVIGFLGQIAFATFPLVQLRNRSTA